MKKSSKRSTEHISVDVRLITSDGIIVSVLNEGAPAEQSRLQKRWSNLQKNRQTGQSGWQGNL
jgi:hypothetical protein